MSKSMLVKTLLLSLIFSLSVFAQLQKIEIPTSSNSFTCHIGDREANDGSAYNVPGGSHIPHERKDLETFLTNHCKGSTLIFVGNATCCLKK